MVAMTPIFISCLTTSAPRTAMRLASSHDGDRLGQHDLAHERAGILELLLPLLALAVALEGGERRPPALDHLAVAVQHQPSARRLAPHRRASGLALVGAVLALARAGLALDRRARRLGGPGGGSRGRRGLGPGFLSGSAGAATPAPGSRR